MTGYGIESSDSERSVSPTAAATVRERRRLRLLKRRWNHGGANNCNSVGSNQTAAGVLSFSAFRRARRIRHNKRMTKEEYLRLKNMVPSVAKQPRVSKVQVIEEAIKYIDSLHVALFQRLRAQESASSRGPAQVSRNESEIQHESNQLCRWPMDHLVPTPPDVTATRLLTERCGHQQRPSLLGNIDQIIKKKKS